MLKNLRISIVFLLICGVLYPLAMTGIAKLFMPEKAEGSLIKDENGNVIGSELIGQMLTTPNYFQGRISSIEYNARESGSSNYAPSNKELIKRTKQDIEAFLAANPNIQREDIPADLLTNSGSGLDPHISPMAAKIQVPRVADARGMSEEQLYNLIAENTEGRQFGIFGEPRVNVLKLNVALDRME